MFGFYIALTLYGLLGGVIGYLIGKYLKKK